MPEVPKITSLHIFAISPEKRGGGGGGGGGGGVKVILCYYYVTYAFQGESAVYSCLNVKELLARNRRNI